MKINNSERYEFIAADITDNCNLRCPFCFNKFSNNNRTTYMKEEVYEKLLKLLPLVNDGNFYISCLFEPTIHPHFIEFLERIPENFRKKVFFTTNLTTKISDEVIDRLSHINIHHINISIDSFNPAVFEELRKGAKFTRFMDNLERLVLAFSRSGDAPPIYYITVVLKRNLNEIPAIVELCAKRYLAKMHEARWVYWGSHMNPSNFSIEWRVKNLISNEEWAQLQRFSDKCPYNFVVSQPPLNYYPDDKQSYSRISDSYETFPLALSISSDGTVSPLGNEKKVRIDINEIDNPYEFFKEQIQTFESLPKKIICMESLYD